MLRSIFGQSGLPLMIGTALLLSACAGNEVPDPVARAVQSVERAASHPDVPRYAAVELDRAQEALGEARAAVAANERRAQIAHLSYIAEQRGRIAMERAGSRATRNEIEQMGTLREQLLLEAQKQKVVTAQQRVERTRQQLDRQRSENIELKEQLSELETKQTDRGLVVTLGGILFDVDRAELRSGARNQVQRLGKLLQDSPDRKVIVEGHTDATGPAAYNRELSQQRAEAVRQALVAMGIDGSRIEARGMGEAYPLATNETAAGRQQNRRVEVVIEN